MDKAISSLTSKDKKDIFSKIILGITQIIEIVFENESLDKKIKDAYKNFIVPLDFIYLKKEENDEWTVKINFIPLYFYEITGGS